MEKQKELPLKFHLVKDGIGYSVDLDAEPYEITSHHVYSFDFSVTEFDTEERYVKCVRLTDILCAEKSEKGTELTVIAVRVLFNLLGTSERSVTLASHFPPEYLKFDKVDVEETRSQIVHYAQQHHDVLFDEHFSVIEFISALHVNPKALVRQLQYWDNDGMLKFDLGARFRARLHKWEDYIYQRILLDKNLFPNAPIEIDAPDELTISDDELAKITSSAFERDPSDPYKLYKIITIEADESRNGFIFCMTEFSGDSLRRFSEVIEPLCESEFGMPAVISKNDDLPYRIDDKVVSHIHKCSMTIADISTRNPNVMYEMGFAHAANKDVIIVCDSAHEGDKEIFDIRNINTIFFDNDEHLREELKKKIRAVLKTNGPS